MKQNCECAVALGSARLVCFCLEIQLRVGTGANVVVIVSDSSVKLGQTAGRVSLNIGLFLLLNFQRLHLKTESFL